MGGDNDDDDDDEYCHKDNDDYPDDNFKRLNLGSVYKMLLSSKLMMAITVLVTLAFFGVIIMMRMVYIISSRVGFDNHDNVIWLL